MPLNDHKPSVEMMSDYYSCCCELGKLLFREVMVSSELWRTISAKKERRREWRRNVIVFGKALRFVRNRVGRFRRPDAELFIASCPLPLGGGTHVGGIANNGAKQRMPKKASLLLPSLSLGSSRKIVSGIQIGGSSRNLLRRVSPLGMLISPRVGSNQMNSTKWQTIVLGRYRYR
ncbi:hypothetical protein CEXT_99021 [Caerostris extrusa]|uniref:Uncharacterized protein n=1 Tax=Caerostris extrusa TaxID=172846 RepID=A0AAV4R966_CAEEX|nr:hypothetical protein CEXT_99021 [Caerostris extrusa]